MGFNKRSKHTHMTQHVPYDVTRENTETTCISWARLEAAPAGCRVQIIWPVTWAASSLVAARGCCYYLKSKLTPSSFGTKPPAPCVAWSLPVCLAPPNQPQRHWCLCICPASSVPGHPLKTCTIHNDTIVCFMSTRRIVGSSLGSVAFSA